MTVHSDWGDWLPRAVADADPDGVRLWYLGCNGFVLKAADGTTVFVDPYLGTGDPPRTIRMIPVPFDPADVARADAVLATHEHSDHVHAPSQAPILERTGADYYGPSAAVEATEGWTDEYDVPADRFVRVAEGDAVGAGDAIEVGSFEISVEAAHDPDAEHPVSYVIEHDAGTFFHGGDARPSEAFEAIGSHYDVDVGAVAFGSAGLIPDKETGEPSYTRWYADENDAARAADQLRLDRLVPTHWDMWKGLTANPHGLADHVRTFDHPRSLVVLEIGDDLTLR